MRFIKLLIFLVIIAGSIYYLYDVNSSNDRTLEAKNQQSLSREPEEHSLHEKSDEFEGDMYDWIGKDASALQDAYGDPARKDESAYGDKWWIYNDLESAYLQFGIKDNSIQTIYVTGEDASLSPLSLDESYDKIDETIPFESDITFTKNGADYTFHLSGKDLQNQPLIKIDDDLFVQLYMDEMNRSLIAARIVTSDVLLSHMPYELTYEGDLPEEPEPSKETWKDIQSGMEKQIFDITNVFRDQFDKRPLEWDEDLQQVAFSHSKDMENRNYFAHESPDGNGLTERMTANDIPYKTAGENIAADYTDGPSVVWGWLNSEEHREILLGDDFTNLGVGVYRNYYTQDYLR